MGWFIRSNVVAVLEGALGYSIAKMLNPQAHWLGPVLLLCPIFLASLTALALGRRMPNKDERDELLEIQERISRLPHRLRRVPKAYVIPKEHPFRSPVGQSSGDVYLFGPTWEELGPEQQDFLIARAVAQLEVEGSRLLRRVGWLFTIVAACIAAALNLWAVPFCFFMAVLYGINVRAREIERGLAADRRAVELTGDKEGAIRTIRIENSVHPDTLLPMEKRIAAIESVELKS